MPTDIWKIPLDSNGAVRGSYYLRHYTEISDTLGTVHFVRGRSVEAITGRQLMSFVSALGTDVDLEPADAEARAAMGLKAPGPTGPAQAEAVQAAEAPPVPGVVAELEDEPSLPPPPRMPAPALVPADDKRKHGKR